MGIRLIKKKAHSKDGKVKKYRTITIRYEPLPAGSGSIADLAYNGGSSRKCGNISRARNDVLHSPLAGRTGDCSQNDTRKEIVDLTDEVGDESITGCNVLFGLFGNLSQTQTSTGMKKIPQPITDANLMNIECSVDICSDVGEVGNRVQHFFFPPKNIDFFLGMLSKKRKNGVLRFL